MSRPPTQTKPTGQVDAAPATASTLINPSAAHAPTQTTLTSDWRHRALARWASPLARVSAPCRPSAEVNLSPLEPTTSPVIHLPPTGVSGISMKPAFTREDVPPETSVLGLRSNATRTE